MMTISNYVAVT